MLQGLPKEKWTPVFITMSARTTANMVQEQVWGGGVLEGGRHCVFSAKHFQELDYSRCMWRGLGG